MDFSKYENKLPYASRKENFEAHKAYNEEDDRIFYQFQEDLYEELGISGNLKRNLLFSKAWSMGHSAGYHEVFAVAEDLVELIL